MKRFSLQVLSISIAAACVLNASAQTNRPPLRAAVDSTIDTSTNDVIATTGTSDGTSAFIVRNSLLTNLFRVFSDGKVGIGPNAPTVPFSIDTGAVRAEQELVTTHASGPIIRLRQKAGFLAGRTVGAINFVNENSGLLMGQIGVAYGPNNNTEGVMTFVTSGGGQGRLRIKENGHILIGDMNMADTAILNVAGNINVTGNINAKYQDVAEWVSAGSELDAATVVVLDPSRDDQVMTSSRSYDTTVAGVVSAQPGLILGEAAKGKEMVATTGRVKVKVDATRAPIAIGDLLVTSDVPGMAMKSQPLDVNGRRFHRPGTIIGKALQPLAGGQGEILVLLSLQ